MNPGGGMNRGGAGNPPAPSGWRVHTSWFAQPVHRAKRNFALPGAVRRRRAPRAVIAGALCALGIVGCVCPPGAKIEYRPPADACEALQRVQTNLSQLAQAPLLAKGTVYFKYIDADGGSHSYYERAALLFYPPRSLRFDITSSLAGSVARVGSNDELFWMWVEPDVSTMWWGQWANIERIDRGRLPLSPDQLLEALMLNPPPTRLPDGVPPLLQVRGADLRLVYQVLDADDWPAVVQELAVDPKPPHQVLEVVMRDAAGQIVMRAELSDYRRVGDGGPYTALNYRVLWPRDKAELRLDFGSVEFRPETPGGWHEFPTAPPVDHIERIDTAAPAGQARASGGEARAS